MSGTPRAQQKSGRVVATAGRRVIVGDEEGERACFLAGQRVVVGDRVVFVEGMADRTAQTCDGVDIETIRMIDEDPVRKDIRLR